MRKSIKTEIEGYSEVLEEARILKKYSLGNSAKRGEVSEIVNRLHPKTLKLRVSRVKSETPTTKTVRLVATEGYLPPFQAGQ